MNIPAEWQFPIVISIILPLAWWRFILLAKDFEDHIEQVKSALDV